MIVAIFLVILTLLALYANRFIKTHSIMLFVLATAISVVAFIFKDHPLAVPFVKGFLGLSLFYIVMLTGALKAKSKLRIKFMSLRKEYSIIGFIVVSPHALFHILQWLSRNSNIAWFGLTSFLLMVPLFITSFTVIRKKMKHKSWKSLQKLAYVVYLLLFIHLILNFTKPINLVLYLGMFIAYIILKFLFELDLYKNKKPRQIKIK